MNFSCLSCIPCIVVFSIVFFRYPRWAVAGLIVLKPIIDLSWDYYIIDNINSLRLCSGVFALLGVAFIIAHRYQIWQHVISRLWLFFLVLNLVSVFVIMHSSLLIDKLDYVLRILNGFIAFVLFMYLFDYKKDKKLVLSIFIAAGTCAMLLWLYHVLSGNAVTSVAGVNDELVRIKGPYHDFWNFLFYGLQTVFCCFAYFTLNHKSLSTDKRNTSILGKVSIRNILLPVLICIGLVMVYRSYSKAGWVILTLFLLLWFAIRKKIVPAITVVASVVIFLIINPFAQETRSLFRKEIDYFVLKSDKWESDTLFMGRYGRWQTGMANFNQLPLANKLLGAQETFDDPDNDYLRVLSDNGIVGFVSYLALLGLTGLFLIGRFVRSNDPFHLFGCLVWLFYLLLSLGSYPMFYPAFQWFMWGIVGLVLSERKA